MSNKRTSKRIKAKQRQARSLAVKTRRSVVQLQTKKCSYSYYTSYATSRTWTPLYGTRRQAAIRTVTAQLRAFENELNSHVADHSNCNARTTVVDISALPWDYTVLAAKTAMPAPQPYWELWNNLKPEITDEELQICKMD